MNRCWYHAQIFLAVICSGLVICAAASADQTTDERMKALSDVVSKVGRAATNSVTKPPAKPTKPKTTSQSKPQPKPQNPITHPTTARVEVCWTPGNTFSSNGAVSEVVYGPRSLFARYYSNASNTPRSLKAVWTLNDAATPISSGVCSLVPGNNYFDNGLANASAPLQPGAYQVKFLEGERVLGSGQIMIIPAAVLGNRTTEAVLSDAVISMKRAFEEINGSRASNAADYATYALPLLSTLMTVHSTEKDIQALYELAHAIIGISKAKSTTSVNAKAVVIDWCRRAQAHSELAAKLAQDAQVKATARSYADLLSSTLKQLDKPSK